MFLRPSVSLIAVLTGFSLALAGCGDGTSSSSTDQQSAGRTNSGPGSDFSMESLSGPLVWDFMIAGNAERKDVYRTNLAAHSRGFVQAGDTLAANILVNGSDVADIYSPALVSARSGRVTIHNRVDGKSYPLADIQTDQTPCSLQGYADEDLTDGIVYLNLSETGAGCPSRGTGNGKTYGISFSDDGSRVWRALNGSILSEVVYTDAGDIDFLLALNTDLKTVVAYSREGEVLNEITGTYRTPQVHAIGVRGVTRDDRYLGIVRDGRFYLTTASRFLESGISALSPALTGLSLNAGFQPSTGLDANRIAIIGDGNTIYGVDQVTRTVEPLADFSSQFSRGFRAEYAWLIDDTLVAALNMEGSESGEYQSEVWVTDVSASTPPERVFETDSRIQPDVFSGSHVFLWFLDELPLQPETEEGVEPDYALKTLIVGSGGTTRIPDGSTAFFATRNVTMGGEERKILAIRSDQFSLESGFESSEIWSVNPATGQYDQMIKRLYQPCFGFIGLWAQDSRINVLAACGGRFGESVLDTEQGTLDHLIR